MDAAQIVPAMLRAAGQVGLAVDEAKLVSARS
jgi:hypothetical protein